MILPLEAARGLAALVVVFHHLALAFPPLDAWLRSHHLQSLTNGPAAVVFFFVLSGFVLTRRYFLAPDDAYLARAAVRRLPRLAGPVLLTCLASWTLFATNSYCYAEAGRLSGSPFLASFANAGPVSPSLWDAFLQGSVLTFVHGHNSYNSNLWTMRPEFIGSLIVFGLAPLLVGRRSIWSLYAVGLMAAFWTPFIVPFLAGMGLAYLQRWKLQGGALIGLVGLYVLLAGGDVPALTLGSVLLVHALAGSAFMANRTGEFLGGISFPLYLAHGLVLCSIGSCSFVWTGSVAVAGVVTVVVSVGVAVLGARADRWWCGVVSRNVGR